MAVRGFQSDIVENWAAGVVTSVLADRLPDGAVPVCKNGQFYNEGPGVAIFGTRKGCSIENEDDPADEAIDSQYFLNTDSTDYHLVVADRTLFKLASGNLTMIGSADAFTADAFPFSWQTYDNYAYVVNGEDAFKTDGSVIKDFGMQQPDGGLFSVAAVGGGSNLPAGDYRVVVTRWNSATGHEGPESDPVSVTITPGQMIEVTFSPETDTQVTHHRIYIEQNGVRNDFFLVVAGALPAMSGDDGWAVGVTSVDIDSTQAELDVFKLLSPGVNNNYPPPDNTLYIQNHNQRMFAATATDIYWSDTDQPEAFNLLDHTLPVGKEDGEIITGLAVLSDALIIFKRNAIYALLGQTPDSWSMVQIDKTVGAVGYPSIGYVDGRLFFMSLRGPQMWAGVDDGINDITTQLIGPNFGEDFIDTDSLAESVIIPHPVQNYVAWAVTPADEDTNSRIIPFDYKLGRWMSSEWNVVDVRSCALVNDSTGRSWPMLGDYDGWIYKLGVADADGVPTGTAATGTITTIKSSTVFSVSGDSGDANALTGRYLFVWNTTRGIRTAERRRITANSDFDITVESAFSSDPSVGDNYAVGGIFFDWHSAFRNGGVPFFKKRIEFDFLELASSSSGLECDVEVYKDMDTSTPVLSRTINIGHASLWNQAIWGVDLWSVAGVNHLRIPIRTTGYNWQTRVIHMSSGEQVYIYRNAVQWQTKTKKTGGG